MLASTAPAHKSIREGMPVRIEKMPIAPPSRQAVRQGSLPELAANVPRGTIPFPTTGLGNLPSAPMALPAPSSPPQDVVPHFLDREPFALEPEHIQAGCHPQRMVKSTYHIPPSLRPSNIPVVSVLTDMIVTFVPGPSLACFPV